MPSWLYQIPTFYAALALIGFIELFSIAGLVLTRRLVLPRLRYHDGINDAVSGTVQAIGVFYGITVGLIAVGVWNTNSNAADVVSHEAAAIGGLYRDVSGYPQPIRDELLAKLREYTTFVIDQEWPAQRRGRVIDGGSSILSEFQFKLFAFEAAKPSEQALHSETLRAFNNLAETRRLRVDAVESKLSGTMWAVIWVGAVISIGIAYFYKIEDLKIHVTLVSLMAGFLAIVLFMIIINDKPFYGTVAISPDPYVMLRERFPLLSR